MERLTNHFDYCKMIECKYYDEELHKQNKCKFFDVDISHCHEKRMNDKLREYEDLEEQGLLLRLPCKVGNTVYYLKILNDGKNTLVIEEFKIHMFSLTSTGLFLIDHLRHSFCIDLLGKTVFLTREEAEAALERMG